MTARVPHECPKHGFLCEAPASAEVYCKQCKRWMPAKAPRKPVRRPTSTPKGLR